MVVNGALTALPTRLELVNQPAKLCPVFSGAGSEIPEAPVVKLEDAVVF